MMKWAICAVALVLAMPGAIRAQEAHEEEGHGGAEAEGFHAGLKNELVLFVGNTRKSGHDAFTVGVDYARVIKGPLLLGFFADVANSSSERDYIVGAGLWLYAMEHVAIFAGIGAEWVEFPKAEHHDEDDGSGEHHEDHTVALGRFGAAYAFHFGAQGRFTLVPQAFLDVVEGNDAWVLGIGLGYVF
jgi:hypothetical protein